MATLCLTRRRQIIWRGFVLAVLALGCCQAQRAWAQVGAFQSVPSAGYFAGFSTFHNGEYTAALAVFQNEVRGGIRNPTSQWIDAICGYTMCGECYYQMGRHEKALEQYDAALNLYLRFPDWMVPVQFAATISPLQVGSLTKTPWGQSIRTSRPGQFPATVNIAQGRINNNDVIMRGGVVQQPVLFPIHAQEIVRCTALAIRRRRELLGPLGPVDALTGQVVGALSKRPAQPNHWSEVWVDVQWGVALAAAGKDAQAKTVLERAIVAGGEFDHPLTSTALLELGRIALQVGDFVAASRYLAESSYSAVQYSNPGVLEEAFRLAYLAHVLTNGKGVFPPLSVAADWARQQGLVQLLASLQTMAAENFLLLPQPQTKAGLDLATSAHTTMGRGDMSRGKLGARLNLVTATALYQSGQVAQGDVALASAMKFQQTGSLWGFCINLIDERWKALAITERAAMDLYGAVLRDPTAADWVTDPLESLSSLVLPHHLALEHWFEVAMLRKEPDRALEIADQLRRHRFLNTLDLGGRLLNLRWILEVSPDQLDQPTQVQRQELLLRHPGYGQLAQQVKQLRAELQRMPLVASDQEAAKQQAAKLVQLADLSLAQEAILREMAVRREPASLLFPPKRSTKEIQALLPEGQAILSFFNTARFTYGFLMTNNRFGYWTISAPSKLKLQAETMLRNLGNWEQNRELKLSELRDLAWQKPAKEIYDLLMKESKASPSEDFKEIVIVPEGLLWYVPFDALLVPDKDKTVPMISQVRVRYSPTVALAVGDVRPRKQTSNMAVVLGRMYPQDDPTVAQEAFTEIERAVPGAIAIKKEPLHTAPAVYASLFDRLIVLNDIPPAETGVYTWSPTQIDRSGASSSLGDWMLLPWGGPEQVLLPGFHTSAERSLKGLSLSTAGQDLFLSVCGLMATGTRTVLISRWRTGGQSAVDLVREFAQELPNTSAADAWQRSVQVVTSQEIRPELEPRIKLSPIDAPPLASNPFFWSGFMMVDTGAPARESAQEPAGGVLIKPQAGAGAVPPGNAQLQAPEPLGGAAKKD